MINRRTLLQGILSLPFGLKPVVKIIGYGWIPMKSKVLLSSGIHPVFGNKYIRRYYPSRNLTVLTRELL